MKSFDLVEAIQGKPFYLKNGCKGIIKYSVDNLCSSTDEPPQYPYVGYILNHQGELIKTCACWNMNGCSNITPNYDAVSMVADEDLNQQESIQKPLKPFNLEKALAGEPVKLRDGSKALVLYELSKSLKTTENTPIEYLLKGLIFKEENIVKTSNASWNLNGEWITDATSDYDIIGMWEEEISLTNVLEEASIIESVLKDLPKPFIPKLHEKYYTIALTSYNPIMKIINENCISDKQIINRGLTFKEEKDAEKVIEFLFKILKINKEKWNR